MTQTKERAIFYILISLQQNSPNDKHNVTEQKQM